MSVSEVEHLFSLIHISTKNNYKNSFIEIKKMIRKSLTPRQKTSILRVLHNSNALITS